MKRTLSAHVKRQLAKSRAASFERTEHLASGSVQACSKETSSVPPPKSNTHINSS